jgi:bacteriocin biosynthesis cyclodehydratase domain-containing protein
MDYSSTPKILKALPVELVETDHGVILRRGSRKIKVQGNEAAPVIHSILARARNAGATAEEIQRIFPDPFRPSVLSLINQLISHRILVEVSSHMNLCSEKEDALDIFFWNFDTTTEKFYRKLEGKKIALLGVNYTSRQLCTALIASGVNGFSVVDIPELRTHQLFDCKGKLIDAQWPHCSHQPINIGEFSNLNNKESLHCVVATSDFQNSREMRRWNRQCHKLGQCFFSVMLADLIGLVGPFVIPGETACYECLWSRQNSNLTDYKILRCVEADCPETQAIIGFLPSMASVLGDVAAVELIKYYADLLSEENVGRLIEVNLLASSMMSKKILKIPRCVVCSPLRSRPSSNIKMAVLETSGLSETYGKQ